ncbi:MAG: LppU/SCO3897 family protein [Actinomycetes bacterium]
MSTTHRGVRWHRDVTGRVRWFNDDLNQWVRYRPGDDAPPRPGGWDPTPATAITRSRPGWRSPYRIVPLAILAFILIVGLLQALAPGNQTGAEAKAAQAMLGKCLVVSGSAGGHPVYKTKPVTCGSRGASVKVVSVLPGTPGAPPCPAGTTGVSLAYAGVRYPHLECVTPAGAGGP